MLYFNLLNKDGTLDEDAFKALSSDRKKQVQEEIMLSLQWLDYIGGKLSPSEEQEFLRKQLYK